MTQQRERQIWQACDNLLGEGLLPDQITADKIGKELLRLNCKAGSLTTRYKYKESWISARNLSTESQTFINKEKHKKKIARDLESAYQQQILELKNHCQRLSEEKDLDAKQLDQLERKLVDVTKKLEREKRKNSRLKRTLKSQQQKLINQQQLLQQNQTAALPQHMQNWHELNQLLNELRVEATDLRSKVAGLEVENSWLKTDKSRLMGLLGQE